jgi:FKBP-type peptidyl-prolyl cis-trans isomerase
MASDDLDLPRIMPRRHITKPKSTIRLTYLAFFVLVVLALTYFLYAAPTVTESPVPVKEEIVAAQVQPVAASKPAAILPVPSPAPVPDVTKTEGWTKLIIKKGDGLHFPKKGDRVKVDYTGSLLNNKVFDSSRAAGREPFVTSVAVGSLIKGVIDC